MVKHTTSAVLALSLLGPVIAQGGQDEIYADGFEAATTDTLMTDVGSLTIDEGANATFTVRLGAAPTGTVAVSVANSGGDTDISVSGGASLTFDASNWDQPQTVTLSAADDADTLNGTATVSVSASGYATVDVSVTEQDDDTPVMATSQLNDTGIVACGTGETNDDPCPVTDYPRQDADFGRDVTDNDFTDGKDGFSFTKLDASGNDLAANATSWSCVRDNVTGSIWEAKTNSGLHSREHTYSWYSTVATSNGGAPGTSNAGTCTDSDCDTQSFVDAVNATSLCGATDWRMPTVNELRSIVDFSLSNPAIDDTSGSYFQNTPALPYWSSVPRAGFSEQAWALDFNLGFDTTSMKSEAKRVRLVRSAQ